MPQVGATSLAHLILWGISQFSFWNAPQYGDPRPPEYILNHDFFQPGRIIVEMQAVGFFIDAKTLQSVGVGELAERAILLGPQLVLQFIGDGHECHASDYSIAVERLIVMCARRELQI
jgi:hypothetical protein